MCSLIIAQLRSPTKFKPCPVAMTRADELTQSGAGVTLHYWPRHRPLSKPTNQPRCTTYDTKYDRGGCCFFDYQYQAFLAWGPLYQRLLPFPQANGCFRPVSPFRWFSPRSDFWPRQCLQVEIKIKGKWWLCYTFIVLTAK